MENVTLSNVALAIFAFWATLVLGLFIIAPMWPWDQIKDAWKRLKKKKEES